MIQQSIARCIVLVLTSIFIFYTHPVSADEIILKNGDRLTGTVTSAEGETLLLETDYSDPVKILKSKVMKINIAEPAEIHLIQGEILKGKVRSEGDGKIIIEAIPGREDAHVAWNNVAAINPPPKKKSTWNGDVTVGANKQSGNTERTSAFIGATAVRRTPQDRYSLRYLFNYAEEDSEISARNTYGAGKYDYFFTEKFYGYLSVELLNDEFKNLNLRTVVGPGVGYQFWDDNIKSLLLEGGISYFSENLEEGEDTDWITARLAADLRYTLWGSVVFSDYLVVYPSLEDSGQYQLRNEAAISTALSSDWSLRLAHILERDSNPPLNVKKNDQNWILGLQYGF